MWQKFKTWHSGLSMAGKVMFAALVAGTFGTLAVAGANPNGQNPNTDTVQSAPKQQDVLSEKTEPAKPVIEKKTITETQPVPFESTTVNDGSLEKGKTAVRTAGVNGVKTFTYEVTYTDGVETNKALVSEAITTQSVTQVTAVGTKVARPNCDPNYSGACVPIASDVDCAGGSGNGPAYVSGPVYVVGADIYDLDRDGNGVACQ